jgi:ribosomal protein S18 acetylase RimI-like enzyme
VGALEERAHRNFCDYMRWTARLDPATALLDESGIVAIRAPNDFPTSRSANRSDRSLPPEQWVKRVDAFFAEGGKTACVNARVGDDDDITDLLLGCGFREWSTTPEMVCEHALEPREPADGATLRFASSAADIAAYARIVAEAFAHLMLPEDVAIAAIDHPAEFLGDDSVVALAEIDGTPVAGAQAVLLGGGETAYVSWVGCADAARGRGLGDTVTRAVTNAAFERGANLVTLEASHFGEHTYARMGYRELFRYRMLLRL